MGKESEIKWLAESKVILFRILLSVHWLQNWRKRLPDR